MSGETEWSGRQPKTCVILIHGTWGRGIVPGFKSDFAPWCRDGSAMHATICEVLAEAETRFFRFNWSGANTPSARFKASVDLSRLICNINNENPASKILLVAHSHGGNISFYSCCDEAVRSAVAGVVCLSTPFLHVSRRDLGERFSARIVNHGAWMVFVLSLVVLNAFHLLGNVINFLEDLPPLVPQLLFGGAVGLAAILSKLAFGALHRWSHEFAGRMALPHKLPFPVLIIRGTADEASSALGGPQLISSSLTRLLRLLLMIVPHTGEHLSADFWLRRVTMFCLKKIVAPSLVVTIIFSIMYLLSKSELSLVLLLLGVGGTIVGVGLFVAVVIGIFLLIPLVWLILVLSALAMIPFGLELALAAVSLQISAEATPPGRWAVVQISPTKLALPSEGPLQHFSHSNPAALVALRSWLRNWAHDRVEFPEMSAGPVPDPSVELGWPYRDNN